MCSCWKKSHKHDCKWIRVLWRTEPSDVREANCCSRPAPTWTGFIALVNRLLASHWSAFGADVWSHSVCVPAPYVCVCVCATLFHAYCSQTSCVIVIAPPEQRSNLMQPPRCIQLRPSKQSCGKLQPVRHTHTHRHTDAKLTQAPTKKQEMYNRSRVNTALTFLPSEGLNKQPKLKWIWSCFFCSSRSGW